ncbi:hypothetical protein Tco_0865334 [Tanacetum coccineum]
MANTRRVWKSVRYGVSKGLDMAYWSFLEHGYAASSLMDTTTMTITRSGMTSKVIEEMITRRVAEALAEQEANRNLGTIVESESENGDDNKNRNGEGRRNGNEGRGNGNGNQGGNASRAIIASLVEKSES